MKLVAIVLTLLTLVLIGIVLILAFGSRVQAEMARSVYQVLLATSQPIAPTPEPRKVITRSAKPDISALQEQGILITAMYTITTDVEKEREAKWYLWNGEMVRVHAESAVLAGVDMAQSTYDDRLRAVVLPASQLFWIVPNVNTSGVVEQVFSPISPAENDGSLTNAATIETHERIKVAACEQGIVEEAARVAESAVSRLLVQAGLNDVRVIAPIGECTQ